MVNFFKKGLEGRNMNTLSIIDAIANKQYNAAEEGMSSLQSKVGAALIARKEEVAEAYGDTLGDSRISSLRK